MGAMEFGYPPGSLQHDWVRNCWRLAPDFDHGTDLWRIVSGPLGSTQVRLIDPAGREIAQGTLEADLPVILDGPEHAISLDRIEIGGELMLFIPSEWLAPGHGYPVAQPDWSSGREASPQEIAMIPTLGAGTMVATEAGPQPIDWLRSGDRVLTRDHGYQPLLWLGQHVLAVDSPETCRPRRIATGAFGTAQPDQDLLLGPATGLLLASAQLDLWFGAPEMLAPARTLTPAAPADRHVLYSLLFDAPEIISAGGLWLGAVHADRAYASLLPPEIRSALGPQLGALHSQAARSWLAPWEVEAILHLNDDKRTGLAA
jgi:hypothetical protein